MHQTVLMRTAVSNMGPTKCSSASMVSSMPFIENTGLAANISDYGCYSTDYWSAPYTSSLSPMKQIEGNKQEHMAKS